MTIFAKPKHGMLLGKFLPPTEGHQFFCNFAVEYCEELTILVGTMPSDPIPGELRFEWMKQMNPRAKVVWCNEVLPQYPEESPDFWAIWDDVVRRYCGDNIDVVFASEDYGHRLAHGQNARFVPVDISRTARAISATKVRSDPFKYWEYIPAVVRPYYVKRVTMFGVESTGKSTLAYDLAKDFHTICVPEYGRTYTETFGSDVRTVDLKNIVAGHMASVAAAKRQANKIMIEDTDPVMTAVWSDMLVGERDPWFNDFTDHADLYLLTNIDIPWVDDGTRYFSNDADRQRFHNICEQELINRGVNYVLISGTREQRLEAAVQAISQNFGV